MKACFPNCAQGQDVVTSENGGVVEEQRRQPKVEVRGLLLEPFYDSH